MEAIIKNFEQAIKDGIAKARKANTVEPFVGVSVLVALVEQWECHAAKVSGDWYNDAGAYENCADDLREVIQAANAESEASQ